MNIAIITGASSGLGREFVYLTDHAGVDEIWVLARRRDRLEALKKMVRTPVRIFAGDVTDAVTIDAVREALQVQQPVVRFLIHAAGLGKIGSAGDILPSQIHQMLAVNCEAAVILTELCLPFMVMGCHIAHICSVAAFQPVPYLNVYAATKAFVYRYCRALEMELKPRGIMVTAVCPYWIRDTEFIAVAQETRNSSYFCHFPFAGKERDVAATAFRDICRGRSVSTPGLMAKLDRIVAKCIPAGIMMRLVQLFR
ncbi:MAG: SDR family NAD(P)-dependent oxidoreductase [Megasphaera sp.]|jgi:short-subunit dehydrogenase|nr:SDR family NAD(P)-dependent oxidoreductase [Megasphaera sp.]